MPFDSMIDAVHACPDTPARSSSGDTVIDHHRSSATDSGRTLSGRSRAGAGLLVQQPRHNPVQGRPGIARREPARLCDVSRETPRSTLRSLRLTATQTDATVHRLETQPSIITSSKRRERPGRAPPGNDQCRYPTTRSQPRCALREGSPDHHASSTAEPRVLFHVRRPLLAAVNYAAEGVSVRSWDLTHISLERI